MMAFGTFSGVMLAVLLLASTQGATASRLLLKAPAKNGSSASYPNIYQASLR
jgi:hypothetical protein